MLPNDQRERSHNSEVGEGPIFRTPTLITNHPTASPKAKG